MTPRKALKTAIEIAGGPTKLAGLFTPPITPEAVMQWLWCPVHRVLAVERLTGVARHELRPDVYPPPEPIPEPSTEAAQ